MSETKDTHGRDRAVGRYRYQLVPWPVDAIQWTGENRDDIKAFLDYLDDPGVHFTADEESGERFDNYNMVLFYAWGDDQEVDPGQWIVVHIGVEDSGEVMQDEEFRLNYEAVSS